MTGKERADAMLSTYFSAHKKAGKSDEWLARWSSKFMEVGRQMWPSSAPVDNNKPVKEPWEE